MNFVTLMSLFQPFDAYPLINGIEDSEFNLRNMIMTLFRLHMVIHAHACLISRTKNFRGQRFLFM